MVAPNMLAVGRRPQFLITWAPPVGCVIVLTVSFPRVSHLRARLGQCDVFYDLVTHCHLSHIVFIRSKSLSPTHTQGGEGVSLHL